MSNLTQIIGHVARKWALALLCWHVAAFAIAVPLVVLGVPAGVAVPMIGLAGTVAAVRELAR